jgi:transcriptional regulator with XRE-family HTH domain
MRESECRNILSANIKQYRKKIGLSQLMLSERLDVSPNFLGSVETGKKWVSPNTLVKLANALNIEVYQLFKPLETDDEPAALPDVTAVIEKYIDEISATIKQTVDHSVKLAVEQSLRKIKNSYINREPH